MLDKVDARCRLTNKEREEALFRLRSGETAASIARGLNVGADTIRRIGKSHNIKPAADWRTKPRPRIVEAPIMVEAPKVAPTYTFYDPSHAEIARLKAKGLGVTKIAALLHLPYRVVEGVPARR